MKNISSNDNSETTKYYFGLYENLKSIEKHGLIRVFGESGNEIFLNRRGLNPDVNFSHYPHLFITQNQKSQRPQSTFLSTFTKINLND